MAAEQGHAPNRAYQAQDGSIHLNGAALYNDAETDISGQLETVLGSSAAGIVFRGGSSANSTTGINTIPHGLTTVLSGWGQICSTAGISSTVAGLPSQTTVQISGSTFQVVSLKHTSTTDPTLVLATSSAVNIAWGVFGTA